MSRILYGSSNVYRNYSRTGHGLDLTLVECTKKAVFDAHIVNLGVLEANSLLVTSVLENFVTEACRCLDDAEIDLFANQQITAHVETLADLLRASPTSVAYVSPLFDRRVPGL